MNIILIKKEKEDHYDGQPSVTVRMPVKTAKTLKALIDKSIDESFDADFIKQMKILQNKLQYL